jgi:sugar transferase EpsL
MSARRLKRLLDVMLVVLLLLMSSPLLLLAAVAIRWMMGTPVLFRQLRPGQQGRAFTLLKLRTMSNAVGPDGQLLPPQQRLTRLGRLLRTTSVDELPQLWNVLRGDMSLVGPRPLRMEYLPLYTPQQARRHEVPPGITGWAQVNGRNAISWEHKFEMDVWYVDHWSLGLDLRILWKTLLKVIKREGLNFAADEVSSPFRGSAAPQNEEENGS